MADDLVKQSPTFEKVAADVAARNAVADDSTPKPDMPITIAAPAYGDPGHVNPALNPAPLWQAPPDRVIVPVQNDPGILGAPPSLADMNKSARLTDHVLRGGSEKDFPDNPTNSITEDSNREAIRAAAQSRMEKIQEDTETAQKDAKDAAKDDRKPVTSSSNQTPKASS